VLPDIEEAEYFRQQVASWPGTDVVLAPMISRERHLCWFLRTLRSLLRKRHFDIIHSHGITAAAQTVLANFAIGVPHVVTSHGMVSREEFHGLSGRLQLLVLSALLSRSSAIVAVTDDARDNHLEMLPFLRRRPDSVVVILNRIDVELFKPCNTTNGRGIRKQLGLGDSVLLAGFLGRFMPQKGFLVLADAVDRLFQNGTAPQFHLVAMESGDFIQEYQAELGQRFPLAAKHISFLPRVPNTVNVLSQLDLVLMPSLSEACGLVAMEAMAMGVPVLGSDCPGLREVLRGTPSAIVPANDPDAWAEAIRRAIDSNCTAQARAYSATARARFDATQTAKQLSDLFENVLHAHCRKR
jgi:glycosyltransferase involved in cell wall biosynthesis